MDEGILKKATEIIQRSSVHGGADMSLAYCVLAQIDLDGYPTAATITPAKAERLQWITFCTGLASSKAKRIAGNNRASLCFNQEGKYNITLVGTIEIITDPAIKLEMWYEGMGEHFSGPEAEGYCVLRFKTERYSLLIDGEEKAGTL